MIIQENEQYMYNLFIPNIIMQIIIYIGIALTAFQMFLYI